MDKRPQNRALLLSGPKGKEFGGKLLSTNLPSQPRAGFVFFRPAAELPTVRPGVTYKLALTSAIRAFAQLSIQKKLGELALVTL